MPTCEIENYHDTPPGREELVEWLMETDSHKLEKDVWIRRLAHWWDENPFATLLPERGWLLRKGGKLVGFLGLIPTCYCVNGKAAPAFIASTWRIDEEHRNAALPMLQRIRRLGESAIIADTTPTPAVQLLLERSGWSSQTEIRRRFVPLGLSGKVLVRKVWPELPACRRLVLDATQITHIASSCSSSGIEKWITPEYLRWFVNSTMRTHQFIGLLDDEDRLTSYLFLTPGSIRGIPAWLEIDHFTADGDPQELHAMIGELVRRPSLLGGRRLLSLAAFPGDPTWEAVPTLHQRTEKVCHFFSIPKVLKDLPKRTVLAEGDWGL